MLTAWNMGQESRMFAAYAGLAGGIRPRTGRLDFAVIAFWSAGAATSYVN